MHRQTHTQTNHVKRRGRGTKGTNSPKESSLALLLGDENKSRVQAAIGVNDENGVIP